MVARRVFLFNLPVFQGVEGEDIPVAVAGIASFRTLEICAFRIEEDGIVGSGSSVVVGEQVAFVGSAADGPINSLFLVDVVAVAAHHKLHLGVQCLKGEFICAVVILGGLSPDHIVGVESGMLAVARSYLTHCAHHQEQILPVDHVLFEGDLGTAKFVKSGDSVEIGDIVDFRVVAHTAHGIGDIGQNDKESIAADGGRDLYGSRRSSHRGRYAADGFVFHPPSFVCV